MHIFIHGQEVMISMALIAEDTEITIDLALNSSDWPMKGYVYLRISPNIEANVT